MNLQTEFPNRVLTLSTGQPGLRSLMTVQVHDSPPSDQIKNQNSKIENPDGSCLDFVSSDETLDRYSEIISVSGWRLDTYRRNPVFQNSHQYGDIIFTLGRAISTEVRDSKLIQRVQFAIDANPMARIAYNLYKGKFLNAVSVGFIPVRWEDANGTEHQVGRAVTNTPLLENQKSKIENAQQFRRKYLEQELLEVSAVGIPANPNALSLAYKSGAVQKAEVQDTIDILLQTISALSSVASAKEDPINPTTLPLLRDILELSKHIWSSPGLNLSLPRSARRGGRRVGSADRAESSNLSSRLRS